MREIFILLAEHLGPFVDGVLTEDEVLGRCIILMDFGRVLGVGVAQWFRELESVLFCNWF
jgi:hypothetical protein